MDKVLTIIKREYLVRVQSKGFILGTILTPLLLLLLLTLPLFLVQRAFQQSQITVLDATGDTAIFASAEKFLGTESDEQMRYKLRREVVAQGTDVEALRQRLNRQLNEGEIAGYLELPADALVPQAPIVFHTKGLGDFIRSLQIEKALNSALVEQRLARAGINPARADELTSRVKMRTVDERGRANDNKNFWLSFALLLLLYLMILFYGQLVMNGVVEEKQSRIIEVLLSSIKPFELLLGKLIGIGAASLTQILIWLISFGLLSFLAAATALASFKAPQLSPAVLFFFFLYFVLGYFLYSSFYAIVGALVSSEADAQQVQMPVALLLTIPLLLLMSVIRAPNSTLATLLSFFPLFSPVLMLARISVQMPPWWQIALSLALLVGTILGAVWLAAKIYRVGVLMYGKPPTLPELFRWLKYS